VIERALDASRPPAPAGRPVGLVRGVLAERVAVSMPLDPYLTLKAASAYMGLSVKTLRRAVNDTPDRALPCYRVGAAILVRRSEADAWLAERRTVGRPSLVAALRAMGLAGAK
jgi:excisionase family DNA binding protein